MRLLGWALVVLAFACSPRGVRLEPSKPGPDAACKESPGAICEAPAAVTVDGNGGLVLPTSRDGFVPLNTRGYNYTRPGEYRPRIPSTPGSSENGPAH